MLRKKICALGDLAVGKTSLLRRFVHGIFSEEYQSTIGVKIDNKMVEYKGKSVELVLWDLDGHADFDRVRGRYLNGCAGYFLVVDSTRPETLERVEKIQYSVAEFSDAPFCVLLNKSDLEDRLDSDISARLERLGWTVLRTSAKTGDGVEEAFETLTASILSEQF